MSISPLLEQSSRVALAAFLHDLGKFAERAKLPMDKETLEINKQLYCPHRKNYTDDKGWFSHVHAAYTGLAMDIIEKDFPELTGTNFAPFGSWKTKEVDDSFINAAAKHHKPDTLLQCIIATADRVASGFDREEFEQYNVADEGTITGKNHYTARQLTLFEQIRLHKDKDGVFAYRYPLQPLSPTSIFPVLKEECEGNNDKDAQEEYLKLWQQFTAALEQIPKSHKTNWSLWLDHFETLWGVFTHAIPSATAFNVKPDVSLYDHSRVTAAIATALWRYQSEKDLTSETDIKLLKEQKSSWEEPKFLLIQGDFFGIQNFIFANGGESNKRAAKLLRGRSFYVSLLCECAALKILEALNLPSTSQVLNAAGKFMIVAANTEETKTILQNVREQLDHWFLQHGYGQAGVGIAWTLASCNDFRRGKDNEVTSPYRNLITRLFSELEIIKNQRFNLCGVSNVPIVFTNFLDSFNNEIGVCQVDGKSPATQQIETDTFVSNLAFDQIEIGNWLTRSKRILITKEKLNMPSTLLTPIFDFNITFVDNEEAHGKFGEQARNGNLIRMWDFSLPKCEKTPLWNGYARRYINAYVPKFTEQNRNEQLIGKYFGIDAIEVDDIKTLNHLACEDKVLTADLKWQGISALSTLKGDVDNLGMIFETGLTDINFSKTAALSRQINNFFTIYLPWICQNEYRDTYTVFAGGDDFFMIGPWLSQIKLASKMRQAFKYYVANNSEIHFSAGISTTKPGLPINQLGEMAESVLDLAKSYNPTETAILPKNAVCCFKQPMQWSEFEELIGERKDRLQELSDKNNISTGYLYGLLTLVDMAEKIKERPENALWHSYFAYRTVRMLDNIKNLDKEQRRSRQIELAAEIAQMGIDKFKGKYLVTLFSHLYQQR